MNISRKENMKKICGFLYKYRHAWLLSYAFIYLPWFMFLEQTVTRDYHIMHASLDDLIPFNEYFIVPYFLWFIYVAGTLIFFLFRSKEDYYKMCAFLFSGMTLSLIICTFFHNGTDFRPVIDPDKNIFSAAVAALYKTDTNTNVFPSVHILGCMAAVAAVWHTPGLRKPGWRWGVSANNTGPFSTSGISTPVPARPSSCRIRIFLVLSSGWRS